MLKAAQRDFQRCADLETKRWLEFCPPRYEDCDLKRLAIGHPIIQSVTRWRPGKFGRGIGLVGRAGTGKRRLIFALARDLSLTRIRLVTTSAIDFERLVSFDQFNGNREATARERIDDIRSAPVLILTELGAERITERGQAELYSLLQHRAEQLLPILWTSPFVRAQLAARYSQDRAPLIIRRLEECSEVIRLERETFVSRSVRTPKARTA